MADSLLTVVNRVRRDVGLLDVSGFSDNDESNDNLQDVNDSYRYLLRQLPDHVSYLQDVSGSITTANGTRLYALDADARQMDLYEWSFENETNNDAPMALITLEFIQQEDPRYDEVTGVPRYLYREGSQFGSYPVPDGVYTIKYKFKKPFTRLSATTDTFIIPDEWLRFVELHSIFLYEQRKGFGNVEATAARVQDELISILAEADLENPTYFLPEMFF